MYLDSSGRAWIRDGALMIGESWRSRQSICGSHPGITPPAAEVFRLTGIDYTECATQWDHRQISIVPSIGGKRRVAECDCDDLFYAIDMEGPQVDVTFAWGYGQDPADALAATSVKAYYGRDTGAAATSTYATAGGSTLARAYFAEAGVANFGLYCGRGSCSHGGAAFSFHYTVSAPAGGRAYVFEGFGNKPNLNISTREPLVSWELEADPPMYAHAVGPGRSQSFVYSRGYPPSGIVEMNIGIVYVKA